MFRVFNSQTDIHTRTGRSTSQSQDTITHSLQQQ